MQKWVRTFRKKRLFLLVMENELLNRITMNPQQCGGKPCIRGMRIRVSDVLELLANGLSAEEILEEMPDLEAEDVQASLLFAARRLTYPTLKAA